MSGTKFRLVTRSDFDGLVCAALLKELNLIEQIAFAHPKDVQDGLVSLSSSDITTNLPYNPYVHLSFDHHYSETIRNIGRAPNCIIDPNAPSAARVVYNYYGGEKSFPNISPTMMEAVDKADSADFSPEDVRDPKGWVLLNFIMDPRTGLGRFHHFRIGNYAMMMELVEMCRNREIDEILQNPDVKERIELYREQDAKARKQIAQAATVRDKVVVLDFRGLEQIWCTNRFTVYEMFPDCNVSIHVLDGRLRRNTVLAVGKSIFNRTSNANIGEIMLSFNGGGHRNAGTCQIANDKTESTLEQVLHRLAF